MTDEERYKRALSGWKTRELFKNGFSTESYGCWKVTGESGDPNGGRGPFIGIFEGKLEDVLRYVVTLPNFWSWGGGGDIEFYPTSGFQKITKNSVKERHAVLEKKARLEAELERIKEQL